MKRFIAIIVAVLCVTTSAFADPWRVFDNARLFTDEEIETIERAIFSFQRETNFDFAVLTTNDYLGKDNCTAIADSFYDSENFGFGRQASGMLYYIDMNQKIPYISTAGEMIYILDADKLNAAHDASFAFLCEGEYAKAVLRMIESATTLVEAYKKDAD